MNKETINQLLQHPENITKSDIEDIELLLKKFPYFNGAVHLSAKAHTLNASLDQGQKTKQSVLYAGNRLTIKNLLSNEKPKTTAKPVVQPYIEEVAKSETEIKISKVTPDSVKENIEFEKSMPLFFDKVDSLSSNISEDKSIVNAIESEKPMLKYYVHLPEFGKDLRISREDLISEYMRFRKVEEVIPPDINEQASIIQKFIEVNPSISRFENVLPADSGKIDLSQKSTVEDEELVSETLANILLKQEKYKKAIEIFEKLMLKYPDKSAYFAAQIQQTRLKLK
ncbi:MAG: tetratricopeptide repeat protein [Bacteroidota bacterium]|nr:tetratricopeptide repeat protein [Bacteroidota bacterium]